MCCRNRTWPRTAFELIGRLNNALAICAYEHQEVEIGRFRVAEALEAFHKTKTLSGVIFALNMSGLIEILAQNYVLAHSYLEKALEHARSTGNVSAQRFVLSNLSGSYLDQSDFKKAEPLVEVGLQLARNPQNPQDEAIFLSRYSMIQRVKGNLGKAIEASKAVIAITETHHLLWDK